ncbi:MAG: hypothetical protein QOE61_4239 [Micromonosporaceae bacterium]|jgi:hypothetical protein|nr:hypothetical protein [Micromonosporaceae bacterium]
MTSTSDEYGRRMSATTLWRNITNNPDQTRYSRWCAGQATAHADRIATLNPIRPHQTNPASALAMRDETWHETAVQWYTMLTDRPEPDNRPVPVCAVADRDAIHAWLNQPAPHPYAGTMDEFLGLHHMHDEWAGRFALPSLIEHAQHAGLFGIPQHTIRLHNVLDHTTGWNGDLLTIHTPTGAALAAGPFNSYHLTDGPAGPAIDIEVTVLRNCATAVDTALAAHETGVVATPDRARPFPTLGTVGPAAPLPDPTLANASTSDVAADNEDDHADRDPAGRPFPPITTPAAAPPRGAPQPIADQTPQRSR